MVVGPLARMLAQIVVPVVAVLARALPAAYAQALNNARRSGAAAAAEHNSQSILKTNRISTSEALAVLNFTTEEEARNSYERIEAQYEKYMRANAVNSGTTNSGGSFYLQSKIYRAREQLVREFHDEKNQNNNNNTTSTTSPPPPDSNTNTDVQDKTKS